MAPRCPIHGVDRRALVLPRITMVHLCQVDTDQRLCAAVVKQIGAPGVRDENVLICVVENGSSDSRKITSVEERKRRAQA